VTAVSTKSPESTKSLARFLVDARKPLLIMGVLLFLITGFGVSKLGFNGDFQKMFAKNNLDFQHFVSIQETYESGEKLVLLLAPFEGDFLEPKNVAMLHSVTEKLWELPYSLQIKSLTNYHQLRSTDDTLTLSPLLPDAEHIEPGHIDNITDLLQRTPSALGSLLSADRKVATIMVDLALPVDAIDRLPAIQAQEVFIEELSTGLERRFPGTIIHHVGGPALEWALLEVVSQDALFLLPICILLCLGILGFMLRSVIAVAGTILTIILSLIATMGIAGWMGYELSPLSLSAPTLVMLLAMADSIHLLTQYILERNLGYSKHDAMKRSLSANLKPILLTSVATAVGFLTINFSDSPGFHDFANITAIGVLVAFLVTMLITPGFVLLFNSVEQPETLQAKIGMGRLGDFVVRRYKWLFWSTVVVVPFIIFQIQTLEVNDDITGYLSDDLPFKQSVNFSNQHFVGFHHIAFSVDTGEPQGINAPSVLARIDEFQQWVELKGGVNRAQSYVDVVKQVHQVMAPEKAQIDPLPTKKNLASQYLLLYELALQDSNGLNSMLSFDRSALRIVVTLSALPSKDILAIHDESLSWLKSRLPNANITSGSRSMMFARIGNVIFSSMIVGTLTALACISALIVMGIGSIRYGLISILPNIIPPALVFGVWAILVGDVNQTAAIIFSVSLGLVVDDTIHFLCKYLESRELGYSAETSIVMTFQSVGVALFTTSVALCLGLMTLLFSSFIPNVTTAIMLASIIATALTFDFFFLPPLLIYFEKFFPFQQRNAYPLEEVC